MVNVGIEDPTANTKELAESSIAVILPIRHCQWGEVAQLTPSGLVASCKPCDGTRVTFSSRGCSTCPVRAQCAQSSGKPRLGTVMVPQPGYWHGSADQWEFRRCFRAAGCSGSSRQSILSRCQENTWEVINRMAAF